jgi:glycogen debranching enzyme
MDPIVRTLVMPERVESGDAEFSRRAEWLVTNGLGGYASGTVLGPVTRRYHGFLVAALPAPLGRVVMLNGLIEELHFPDGRVAEFNPVHEASTDGSTGHISLHEFRLEMGLPIWRYNLDHFVLEKRIWMLHRQNTVHISYRFLSCPREIELKLRPLIQFRKHEDAVTSKPDGPYVLTVLEDQYEVSAGRLPPLRLLLYGRGEFVVERKHIERVQYPLEAQRGYQSIGDLWSPGSFHVKCSEPDEITLVASTETWQVIRGLSPSAAWKAATAPSRRIVPSSRPPRIAKTAPRLVWIAPQVSGARSRVNSSSATCYATTASSSRTLPLSRAPRT